MAATDLGRKSEPGVRLREKLVTQGTEALTDEELLAVTLGGSSEALELAGRALAERSLAEIAHMPLPALRMVGGMGIGRAATLSATFELGRRIRASEAQEVETIERPEDVLRLFQPMFEGQQHEELWVIYLSSAHRILEKRRVGQGGVSTTPADCKIVVKRAVELLAAGIILVHNHPSGITEPSNHDRTLTAKLATGASLFDIEVLDHIIISPHGPAFSFRSNGLLE